MELAGTTIDLDTGATRTNLRGLAARWAAELANLGVVAGDRVAVCALGTGDVFVLQAACGRLGAALVPLSWRASPRELAAILDGVRPAIVLHDATGDELVTAADPFRRHANRSPLHRRALASLPQDPLLTPSIDPDPDPDAIAQILFTSGTTGKPRGVVIRWRQLAANAEATRRTAFLTCTDRVLACLPLFHTGGLNCLATPVLALGGTVVVASRFDAVQAVAAIDDCEITALIAVPSIYERLLDAGLAATPSLRVLLVGGAPVSPALLARCTERGLALRQGYGLTEAGPNCFDFGTDTVGEPVLDARLVNGELWLRGPQVAGQYLVDGELVPATDGDGWLHTGDLLERSPRGYRVVGRKKDMYISGGENVYPAEVELALADHPAIAEVCVIGVADPTWGEVGLAAIVPRGDVDTAAVAAWARDRLAAYKIPKRWQLCDDLPRTASGKVARDELRRRWA
jgi:fatty-acyl-CoA synthase